MMEVNGIASARLMPHYKLLPTTREQKLRKRQSMSIVPRIHTLFKRQKIKRVIFSPFYVMLRLTDQPSLLFLFVPRDQKILTMAWFLVFTSCSVTTISSDRSFIKRKRMFNMNFNPAKLLSNLPEVIRIVYFKPRGVLVKIILLHFTKNQKRPRKKFLEKNPKTRPFKECIKSIKSN